jgi:hypothetical protein
VEVSRLGSSSGTSKSPTTIYEPRKPQKLNRKRNRVIWQKADCYFYEDQKEPSLLPRSHNRNAQIKPPHGGFILFFRELFLIYPGFYFASCLGEFSDLEIKRDEICELKRGSGEKTV